MLARGYNLAYWSILKKNPFFKIVKWREKILADPNGNIVDTHTHTKSTQGSSATCLKNFLKLAKKNKVKSRRESWSFNFWRLYFLVI